MLRSLESSDASVQGTNDDAQISKLSCSKAGYFRDEFIQYFVRRSSRRSPLINRGYYSRHAALRQMLECFLASAEAAGRPPQVLVLGAGFDTTWFQLSRDKGRVPYKCLEVDFKEVTQRKAAIIAKEPVLRSQLDQYHQEHQPQAQPQPPHPPPPHQPPAQPIGASCPQPIEPSGHCGPSTSAPGAAADAPGYARGNDRSTGPISCGAGGPPTSAAMPGAGAAESESKAGSGSGGADTDWCLDLDPGRGQILSPYYCLLPVDLRDLAALEAAVRQAGLDLSAPTYILSECVLVYMDPQHSSAIVGWAARTFPNAVMAIYEQIRPDDAFGRQMVSNLEMRGCPLRGLPATPSLEAHRARLTAGGWAWADARDMDTLYRTFVDHADRARVERLELFDELEEWHMIQEHYCIALGRNDRDGYLGAVGFNTQAEDPKAPPPPLSPPPPGVLPRGSVAS